MLTTIVFMNGECKAQAIALKITKRLIAKEIALDVKFPTQGDFIEWYRITKNEAEKLWKLLKDGKIIYTIQNVGTFTASTLPGLQKKIIVGPPVINRARILLDQHDLPEYHQNYQKSFNQVVENAAAKYKRLSAKEESIKMIPGLQSHLKIKVNNSLSASFKEKEIYLYRERGYIIFAISKAFLSAADVFLMATTASDVIKTSVKKAKKTMVQIQPNYEGRIDIHAIAEICTSHHVRCIYIAASPSQRSKIIITELEMETLKVLNLSYNLIVIIDDLYPGLPGDSNFTVGDMAKYHFVIYLRPVSRAEHKLYSTRIIACNKVLMDRIIPQFGGMAHLVDPQFGYTMLALMHNNLLHLYEQKAHTKMKEAQEIMTEELLLTRLWKEEALRGMSYGFIGLQPITGVFISDVCAELVKLELHIFNIDPADNDGGGIEGIVISIPAMKNKSQLVQLTKEISNTLEKMIIIKF